MQGYSGVSKKISFIYPRQVITARCVYNFIPGCIRVFKIIGVVKILVTFLLELSYRNLSTLTTHGFLPALFGAIKITVPPALISKMAARNILLIVLDK